MNFGLLCDDPAAAALLSVFRHSSAHRLTRAVLVSEGADALLHGVPGVQFTDHWQDLLTAGAGDVDAVIVGGASPDVWDGAKQLASASIPLLVFPTIADGAAALYELSLIRDDRRGVLSPAWLHRFDPALVRWREQIRASGQPAGTYVRWEREVALGTGVEIPRSIIDEELFRDADLWRFLSGGADQVTALRTGGTTTGAIIQSVVLAGKSASELTWTIKSGAADRSRLIMPTEHGEWRLERGGASSGWTLVAVPKPAVSDGVAASLVSDSAERLLDAFAATASGKTASADWTDVLHAAEIVDASHRSLERRRTIDLHHEALSERAIFKTQMTAMGCSVLMLTVCVLVGCLAVDSLAPLNSRLLKFVVLLVSAPMFAFLLVQFLLPLTRSAGDGPRAGNP